MRSIKKYTVIKSKFYIKSPLDYGYKESVLKSFDNITDAEIWTENNIENYINKKEASDTCLQVIADFGDDKCCVLRTYTL